jgi:hypothetical protein
VGLGAEPSKWRNVVRLVRRAVAGTLTLTGRTQLAGLILGCGRPSALLNSDHIWRVVKNDPDYFTWNSDEDRWMLRLTGKDAYALRFDYDLSVMWREHLELHNLGLVDALNDTSSDSLIFEASVNAIRELRPLGRRLHIVHTPEGPSPSDCAHASVLIPKGTKPEELTYKTEIERQLTLAWGALPQPPDGA